MSYVPAERTNVSSTSKVYLLFVLRAVLYACGPIGFVSLMSYGLDPRVAVSYFLILGGALALITGVMGEGHTIQNYTQYGLMSKQAIGWFVGLAFVTPLNYLFYVYAMSFGTITETTVLARLSPVIFIFLSVKFLGDRIYSRVKVLFAYILMLGGVIVFTYQDLATVDFVRITALILGVLVAFMQAFELYFMLKIPRHTSLSRCMTLGYSMLISGFIAIIIFVIILPDDSVRLPTGIEFGILVFLGFATIVIPHLIGISITEDTKQPGFVASNAYLVVLITAPLAFIVHGEQVSWLMLVLATTVIAAGIWLLKAATES